MKLEHFNPKTTRVLRDLVAYKWLKVDSVYNNNLIVIPDSVNEAVNEGGMEERMGNKYTCEVIAIGPDVKSVKPGDRFLLHEYDKVEQAEKWNEDNVMFTEELSIKIKLDKDVKPFVSVAKPITDKMMNEYEDY